MNSLNQDNFAEDKAIRKDNKVSAKDFEVVFL